MSSDQWQQENKGGTANDELWLLLEYCDKGSVQVGTLRVIPPRLKGVNLMYIPS